MGHKNAMLHKVHHRFRIYDGPAPQATHDLEEHGYALVEGLFSSDEIADLKADILAVYDRIPPDRRAGSANENHASMFRYGMFNRSPLCQRTIADRRILDIVEPLVGPDCHVIACTSWKNHADPAHAPRGQEWHSDAGPHIPRSPDVEWPDNIPYPIFAVATHLFLEDCALEDGPTALVPGSHKSGQPPPVDKEWELELEHRGRKSFPCIAKAGDLGLFVSDVWHRRLPPRKGSTGRFFLQTNYARRDIAQRVLPTTLVNHASPEAAARATTERERLLIGLHPERFYDG